MFVLALSCVVKPRVLCPVFVLLCSRFCPWLPYCLGATVCVLMCHMIRVAVASWSGSRVMLFCANCLPGGQLSRPAHTWVVSKCGCSCNIPVLGNHPLSCISHKWALSVFLVLVIPCCVCHALLYSCCYATAMWLYLYLTTLHLVFAEDRWFWFCCTEWHLSYCAVTLKTPHFYHAFLPLSWLCLCHAAIHLSCCIAILVMYCLWDWCHFPTLNWLCLCHITLHL